MCRFIGRHRGLLQPNRTSCSHKDTLDRNARRGVVQKASFSVTFNTFGYWVRLSVVKIKKRFIVLHPFINSIHRLEIDRAIQKNFER